MDTNQFKKGFKKMSSNKIKFNNFGDTLRIFATAWEAGDLELARQAMLFICEDRQLEELEANFLISIDHAMGLFKFFVKTGLDCSEDGTPTRAFFLKVNSYVIDNATPEIKRAMDEAFNMFFAKDLKPTGYDENGKPCYSMKDVCDVVGCTEEQARETIGDDRLLHPDHIHRIN